MAHYPDGSVYEGEFQSDLENGFGVLKEADGKSEYEGYWRNGLRCGKGVLRRAGLENIEGMWRDDLLVQ